MKRFLWDSTPMPRKGLKRLFRIGLRLIVPLVCLGFLVCGFARFVNPAEYGGYWGYLFMSFPLWFWAMVLLVFVTLVFDRRLFLLVLASSVIGWGAVHTYFPMNLHFFRSSPPAGTPTFTLMTFNVSSFEDKRRTDGKKDTAPTLRYILGCGADVVCLQETTPLNEGWYSVIDKPLLDTLCQVYPYMIPGTHMQSVFSKYPIRNLDIPYVDYSIGGDVEGYAVDIDGEEISIINVHLQSFGLSSSDKNLYHDLTDLQRESYDTVHDVLLSKVSRANATRVSNGERLLTILDDYCGKNTIICGDFNDVTGCYVMNMLEEAGMHDAFGEVAFLPMVTFNADRMYFCIDHIMYRGDLRPVDVFRGDTKVSDHYPLFATFAMEN